MSGNKLSRHAAKLARILGYLDQLEGTLVLDGYKSYRPTLTNLQFSRNSLIEIINDITSD